MAWENIPEELKLNGLWCCWKLTDKGKIPIDISTGKMARSNDRTTFTTYSNAFQALSKYYQINEQGQQTGGLGLGIFNGYSAIDIDHCVNDGVINDLARDVIDYCASYTEYSPSGNGIRIIFKTDTELDKAIHYINNSKLGLEIYISDQTNKYVTITGDVLYPANIVYVDLTYILEKYMKKDRAEPTVTALTFDITKYANDSKLQELWNGTAPGAHANESELDLALCSKLAYYSKGDYLAIDKAFRNSPYYQSKDKEHLHKWEVRDDYREATILKAIAGVKEALATYNDYSLTDTGNARKFIDKYGEIIRYNIDNKMWMYYNGKYWQTDVFNHIKTYAEFVIEEMKQQAKGVDDEETRKAMIKNVKRALQSSGKAAMIKEAEHINNIPITNYMFDEDSYLLNTASGIVNMRNGQIAPHNKDAMLSKYTPYEIDFKNEPKLWLEFLNDIFENNAEIISYVQRVLGYSMTG